MAQEFLGKNDKSCTERNDTFGIGKMQVRFITKCVYEGILLLHKQVSGNLTTDTVH